MRQILPVLFLFLFAFICPQFALAGPVISISSPPSSVVAGEEFVVTFNVSGLGLNSQYFMKALGGNTFSEVDTWNSSWLQQNADWPSMPSFVSGSDGNSQTSLKARFDSATTAGSKEFKIRIRKHDNTTNYDSSVISISVTTHAPSLSPSVLPSTVIPGPDPESIQITSSPTISKTIYKINKPKDQDGGYLSGVKINIDNLYTHHEDDETLEFCPTCFCDTDKQVPCGLGVHTITLTKTGYVDWSEQRNFSSGNTYEVSPVLTIISTSPTGTPTNSPTPTPVKSITPISSLRGGTPTWQSSPTPSQSSAVLGTATNSGIVTSSAGATSSPSTVIPAKAGIYIDSSTSPSGQSLPNSVLKYTFIFGVILSALSGGWLYMRHKTD